MWWCSFRSRRESKRLHFNAKTVLDLGCTNIEAYDAHPFKDVGHEITRIANQYGEFWIGNNIFKYFDQSNYIQVENNDIATILDIRTNGLKLASNIKYHNAISDTVKADPRSNCTIKLFEKKREYNFTTQKVDVYVYIKLYKQNGIEDPNGRLNVTINWGDGSSENRILDVNSSVFHQYSNPTSSNYLITVEGNLEFCHCTCSPNPNYSDDLFIEKLATVHLLKTELTNYFHQLIIALALIYIKSKCGVFMI